MTNSMEKVLKTIKMETNMLETSKMTCITVKVSTHVVKIVLAFVRTTLEISEIITDTAMGLFNTRMETNIKAYSLMVRGMDSEYTIMQTVDLKESGIKIKNKVMGHTSLNLELN